MSDGLPTPKVFISYSWTSDEHVAWVLALGTRLRHDGVDVILDQWDLIEGQDKYVFMEQMVKNTDVTKVLAICDKVYARKADDRKGGVGTESQIISKEVYDQVSQEKFIPLVRQHHDEKPCLPLFFASRIYIDFSNDDDYQHAYERLIRNLFGKPERVKPAIGKPPGHILIDSAPVVVPAQKLERLKVAVQNGKSHTHVLVQDFLESFVGCLEEFRIVQSSRDAEAFDAAFDRSVDSFTPFRNCFIEFIEFVADYMNNPTTCDSIVSFLESIAPFQERPVNQRDYGEIEFDNFKFINYELYLYLIATLIKKRAYESAAFFIEHQYIVPSTLGGSDFWDRHANIFNEHVAALDIHRRKLRKLNRISVTADLILARATVQRVSFTDLLQADFLIFIRRHFPLSPESMNWYPRLAIYLRRDDQFELFVRAVTPSGLTALKALLRVESLSDLAFQLNKMIQSPHFNQVIQSGEFWLVAMQPASLLNLERITAEAKTMV